MKRPGGQGSLEDTCLPFSCPRTATPLPWVVPASLWGEILSAYWVCQHFPQWISDWLISFLCLIAEATGLCQASTFPHDTAGEKQGLVVNPVLVNAVVWMSVCGLGVYRLVDRRMSAWIWKAWGVAYVNGFNNCFSGWSRLIRTLQRLKPRRLINTENNFGEWVWAIQTIWFDAKDAFNV